jgi:hypothetical protein
MMIIVVLLDKKADLYKLSLSSKMPQTNKMPSFKDLKNLDPIFYFLVLILGINYAVYFPLTGNLLTVF